MRAPNTSGESPVETVQDAIHRTVFQTYLSDGSHLPPKAIAQGMNLPVNALYDIADEHRERQLRAAETPSLVLAAARHFLVLDVMERLVGRVAFEIPRSVRPGDVLALTAESAQRFGKYLAFMAKADGDGDWTLEEIARAKQKRDLLFATINATIARAEQQLAEQERER